MIKEYVIDLVKPIGYILILIGLIITPMPLEPKILLVLGVIIHGCSVKFTFHKK